MAEPGLLVAASSSSCRVLIRRCALALGSSIIADSSLSARPSGNAVSSSSMRI
ncbi:Uncharacterised protein [Bordetella pertussis]|nr:Uncharacterised protein [Bordetella pertussis]CFW02390.1 Uncharacterised protein [Bordetella pertussis]CPN45363.1 Uncharacterised protein [Bordetella pertussis]